MNPSIVNCLACGEPLRPEDARPGLDELPLEVPQESGGGIGDPGTMRMVDKLDKAAGRLSRIGAIVFWSAVSVGGLILVFQESKPSFLILSVISAAYVIYLLMGGRWVLFIRPGCLIPVLLVLSAVGSLLVGLLWG